MPALLHDLLDRAAQQRPDQPAVIDDAELLTYRSLVDVTCSTAYYLTELGIGRGDRLLLHLPNSSRLVVLLLAASRIGAIFSIVSQSTKMYNLQYIVRDCYPSLIITSSETLDLFTNQTRVLDVETFWSGVLRCPARRPLSPGISVDPACLIYTSGSTGHPKAIISPHRAMLFATQAIGACIAIRSSDVIGLFLPLSFDYGLYQVFLTLQAGATLAISRETDAGPGILPRIRTWQVSGLPVVPALASMLIRLARRTRDSLPPLRFITNTGAHLPPSYVAELNVLWPGCDVFVMFGLTECKRVSILQPADYARKPSSVGKPLPDTECLIVDAEGNVLPPGHQGELVVRGPHVMAGYWDAPELTAKRFRRWGPGLEYALFTGDWCSLDSDGFLYFHGRSDDIYKQSGYRVSALEVEQAATDIPGVHQAAIVLPEDDSSSATLFVVADVSAADVFARVRERLEDYKLPGDVILVDKLPLTTNGKVHRDQLHAYLKNRVRP